MAEDLTHDTDGIQQEYQFAEATDKQPLCSVSNVMYKVM